ncbi:hypothetical protein [Endozoicomonas sp. ISHI1]|uniref:hypothetical protein n=1 Tax=Endozoicomonas sp. ISHI1 TaxID=2825882 RepID=UPI0021478A9F|nr:hypothetical protein [Endozoicomonas sp. ISHI1]
MFQESLLIPPTILSLWFGWSREEFELSQGLWKAFRILARHHLLVMYGLLSMTTDYGFRVRNDHGSYVVDGVHFNSHLVKEVSLGKGFHNVSVGRKYMPTIAVRDGCAMIMGSQFSGDICTSVTLYIIPNGSTARIRVFSVPVVKDQYGMAVYNAQGEMVFSSAEKAMSVHNVIQENSLAGIIEQSENPPYYNSSEGAQTPKGNKLFNYVRQSSVLGDWLVVNSISAFGGTGTEVGDYGHGWFSTYALCTGLVNGYVNLKSDNDLLISDLYMAPGHSFRIFRKFLDAGSYIITLYD